MTRASRNAITLYEEWTLADFEDAYTGNVVLDGDFLAALIVLRRAFRSRIWIKHGYLSAQSARRFRACPELAHADGLAADLAVDMQHVDRLRHCANAIGALTVFMKPGYLHIELRTTKATS